MIETSSQTFKNVPFMSLIAHYLEYYANGTGHTARAKRLDLNHFLKFLTYYKGYSKPEKLLVSDWDNNSVKEFLETCLSKGEAPATIARRLATLKHMGRTFSERVANFENPARQIKSPIVKATKPKNLTSDQIKKIKSTTSIKASQKQSFNRYRNQIIFELLLDTGLRAEEVRYLKIAQLDYHREWIKNVKTKSGHYRNVFVSSDMRSRLEEYLTRRAEKLKAVWPNLSHQEDQLLPLFISSYSARAGKPESFMMGAKSIWRGINELSNDIALHPHLLRHSYAIDLLEASKDVKVVAEALGHSDIRITMRYTEASNS